ncbi:MAG: hypothetical protein H6581_01405 [Bacteroidia bacterium]|nr:hypothetical protein [Bacteroidia bacterium]
MRSTLAEEVKWHEGLPWPETTHSVIIDLDPVNAAAIFADANSHKEFNPNVLRCEVTRQLSPTEYHLFYKLKVPFPIISTTYTTHNLLETLEDGSYRTSWSFVEAEESRDMSGSVTFTPHDGRTLMTYNNLVVPKNGLAGLFASRAVKEIGETVVTIADYLSSYQNRECPELARRRMSFLSRVDAAGAA